jgi:hypothetical protein
MNINDIFTSDYLKASDLANDDSPRKVRIANVTMEPFGEENKLVIHFAGDTKKMIANRTNSMTISEQFGPDTDSWIGGVIVLFSTKVPFGGRIVDALRVSVPKQPAKAPAKPVNVVPNARARQAAVDMGDNSPADVLDDDVPF